jgi:hypothetical protein
MEFLALFIWLMLAGTALILGPFALTTPGAGLSVLAGLGGVAACGLFIWLDGAEWVGWTLLGLSLLGVLGAGLAAVWLIDDRFVEGSAADQVQASAVGLQLPFYTAAVFVSLLVALQIATVS